MRYFEKIALPQVCSRMTSLVSNAQASLLWFVVNLLRIRLTRVVPDKGPLDGCGVCCCRFVAELLLTSRRLDRVSYFQHVQMLQICYRRSICYRPTACWSLSIHSYTHTYKCMITRTIVKRKAWIWGAIHNGISLSIMTIFFELLTSHCACQKARWPKPHLEFPRHLFVRNFVQ